MTSHYPSHPKQRWSRQRQRSSSQPCGCLARTASWRRLSGQRRLQPHWRRYGHSRVNLGHCQWGATSVQECDISCEQSRHGILCKWQLSCRSWPTQLCAVCHSWPRLFAVTIHRHSHLNAFTESLSWTMVWQKLTDLMWWLL